MKEKRNRFLLIATFAVVFALSVVAGRVWAVDCPEHYDDGWFYRSTCIGVGCNCDPSTDPYCSDYEDCRVDSCMISPGPPEVWGYAKFCIAPGLCTVPYYCGCYGGCY